MKDVIFFTGGHHNSALEVAKVAKKKGYKIIWLGHKYNLSSKKTISGEYREVRQESITFKELVTGRFYKKISIFQLALIAFGFLQSFYYILKYKPKLIYSSGGFMAVPVVIAGFFLGVPSVTHEQTVVAGWANKAVAPFVKRIFLTYVDNSNQYPKDKSVVVGLPLNSNLSLVQKPKKLGKFIYITAGKQGSEIINQAVFPLITDLVKKYTVVHQIGFGGKTNPEKEAQRIKSSLGNLSRKYVFADYFYGREQAKLLKFADIVISRSGAHTVYELVTLNKKSILIPIPWVSHNEQFLNAQYAQKNIGSILINESDLSTELLGSSIESLSQKPKNESKNLTINDATEKIFAELEKMALL